MTPWQQYALEHHCRFAFETALPGFAHLIEDGRASLVLTCNSGHE